MAAVLVRYTIDFQHKFRKKHPAANNPPGGGQNAACALDRPAIHPLSALMEVERLNLAGVLLLHPRRFTDARGYFVETYNKETFAKAGIDVTFVQDNQSFSAARGTVRALHFQVPPSAQAKLVRVLRGSVYDVVVDVRAGSPSYGRWISIELHAERGEIRAALRTASVRSRATLRSPTRSTTAMRPSTTAASSGTIRHSQSRGRSRRMTRCCPTRTASSARSRISSLRSVTVADV